MEKFDTLSLAEHERFRWEAKSLHNQKQVKEEERRADEINGASKSISGYYSTVLTECGFDKTIFVNQLAFS